ncbi:MAG: LUD domain-containing protein [Chitinophagaceae bacterium]
MSSRDQILATIKTNQPALVPLPSLEVFANTEVADADRFITTLQGIGGKVIRVGNEADLAQLVKSEFPLATRIISAVASLPISTEQNWNLINPHELETVDLAIIKARIGVAENGSVWITDDDVEQVRVLPFICENLAAVLSRTAILNTMHQAYDTIADADYGFGVFIAGPSKTADIEQSLVLGAHGPKTMTIFLVD